MAALNWDGTEKVIDQSCHTVTLTNDVYKNPMPFENNNIRSPKKTRMLYFKNVQLFISKYPLKHQYLLVTSLKAIIKWFNKQN